MNVSLSVAKSPAVPDGFCSSADSSRQEPRGNGLLWKTIHLTFLGWFLLAFIYGSEASADGYRVDTGDVLRIAVYGEPAYPLQVAVDGDGAVTLPLLGEIKARGQSVRTLTGMIEEAFRQRELLWDPFVQVEIAEYRPFFISGAVADPGAYAYRPQMTVRHALVMAGGFKAIRIGDKAPSLAIADLRSDQVEFVIEAFRYQVRQERLKAELQDRLEFPPPDSIPVELSPEIVVEILSSEESQIAVRRASFDRLIANLEAMIEEAAREADAIRLALSKKEMVVADQLAELEINRELKAKGLMRNSDLLAAERAYNGYLGELAQIEAQASRKQQDAISLESEIEKLRSSRKVEIISEIQETQIRIAKAQNKVKFISDQLVFISTYGEHKSFDELRNVVQVTIHRSSENGSIRMAADETTPVQAGDIVEVAILIDHEAHVTGSGAVPSSAISR